MSAKERLLKLSKDSLHELCRKTGIETSGTKPILSERLIQRFEYVKSLKKPLPSHILSVDIGWRNFSYCRMDVKNRKVVRWERLNLAQETQDGKDSYDPITYAKRLNTLCDIILDRKEMAIVVERQRYRSQSARNIFEWTIRANAVEAMIHAIIQSRKHTKGYLWEIETCLPRRMSSHFFPEESQVPKNMRVKLVKEMLLRETKKGIVDDTHSKEFIGPTGNGLVEIFSAEKKKDDISDSLLQALAWIDWREYTITTGPKFL